MINNPVELWHQILAERNTAKLSDFLADDVVFYSPVVHTPQEGKPITILYLASALRVFVNDSFQYVRQVVGEHDAILEFQVEIDGISVNGVDMLKWNENGQVIEFKVMLRPLKAVNLIHQKMGEMLKQLAPK